MNSKPANSVSVLLVCSTGLVQKSLITAVNAVPLALVVGKAANANSALHLAHQLSPDVLLVDANSLQSETLALLQKSKKKFPKMICIVMMTATLTKQKLPFLQSGADFVLDDRSLDQELTEIFRNIQAYQKNRSLVERDN